ncbi:GH36-type glycosyl hydrolase domain-containing protein [Paenibacillus ihbetae]|uniref:Cellobiose phosphorylase n=1 Tax=Paenibacillus ihbetae TaxID=1870820 RepID=A0ABX3K313_9BACL|nr:cellobiose phosphorylase [Paenibacillus ihbetae]OOC63831.1 cellobiose phosphorylase [Paenibacillus ihbetae]
MTTITQDLIHTQAGDLCFSFWQSGDLYKAVSGNTMINQLISSPLDGSMNNIYLRIHNEAGITSYPLLGIHSSSKVSTGKGMIVWEGTAEDVEYEVSFVLQPEGIWFWDVQTRGQGQVIDIIYGQDVGIADIGAVRSNEAYLSQYIDHRVFEHSEQGYVVCSRQNQPQGGAFPYLQQGSLTGASAYSTDGFQFFGLSYKETNTPVCVSQEKLACEVYQYEFAYTGLQSKQKTLNGEEHFVFYGLFKGNHPAAVEELEYLTEVQQAWQSYENQTSKHKLEPLPATRLKPYIGKPLQALELSEEEINARFPIGSRHQEERNQGNLLAFFTDTYEHIVLKQKEMLVERPHGHILLSGDNLRLGAEVMATTSFMYGIFNSHVVVGNTNMNKMMSNSRSALNVPKTSGQRIYVEKDGTYHLLTMPSMFEIGFNYARWYYKTEDDMLIITNYTVLDAPEVRLHVRSENGIPYNYLVTNHVTMNVNEYETPVHMTEEDGVLTFHSDTNPVSAKAYPELQYRLWVDGAKVTVGDETTMADGVAPGSSSLVTLRLDRTSDWTLTIQGLLEGKTITDRPRSVSQEIIRYREYYRRVMNGFHLSRPGDDADKLFKLNALAWWYTHNMFVHYSSPHGLEQYGGAAWGTRDVCQGPVEYFMATQKYEQVRDILKMVYCHQYEDSGNWPQWFMFDRYFAIQQEESHGDIIVWPLKVLSDYLTVTQDYSILDEQVPYTLKHSFQFTEKKASILEHAKKEIEYIRNHFLHDTHLSSYGDGDWDDTLQPANAQLKQFMVSSWTVALTYQTMKQLSTALQSFDQELAGTISDIAANIGQDFKRYMLNNDVIPGFLYLEDPEQPKLMLHPEDQDTGIQYRLLPMTRSMIAELLEPEQARSHYELIQSTLLFPDGVRLMNRPASYKGGVSTHFKRAEQASNFGREVGLQYVHAHIRYIEAMAKLGHGEDVWKGLETINPVGIQEVVPNAAIRQSNAYFSSSDGKFNTRYEAQEHFDDLRSGKVEVKGGWRIYSSGPGIYMNQLISNALGIRQDRGDLVLDPVIPASMDGLHFDYEFAGTKVTFVYHVTGNSISRVVMNGTELTAERINNPYREGGLRVSIQQFEQMIQGRNRVEIFM